MNSRIASAKRTFLTITIVCFGFIYFAIHQIERNTLHESKIVLSALVALKNTIGLPLNGSGTRELTNRDVPTFARSEMTDYATLFDPRLDTNTNGGDAAKREKLTLESIERFADKPNGSGHVFEGLSIPYATSRRCDVVRLRPSEKFDFPILTILHFPSVAEIESEGAYILSAEQYCLHPRFDIPLMVVMPAKKGLTYVALPDSVLSYFPEVSILLRDDIFRLDPVVVSRLIPTALKQYFRINEFLRILDLRALDVVIVNHISRITGKVYEVSDVTSVLKEIYTEDVNRASLFGFSVTVISFLRFVPVILFLLSFVYWRQLRRLVSTPLNADEFWSPMDADDFFGLLVSYAWVVTPVLAILTVYILYPSVFGLSSVLFGREITPLGIVFWHLPVAQSMGWYGIDYAAVLLVPVLVGQLVILIAATRLAWKICKTTRKVTFRGMLRSWK